MPALAIFIHQKVSILNAILLFDFRINVLDLARMRGAEFPMHT